MCVPNAEAQVFFKLLNNVGKNIIWQKNFKLQTYDIGVPKTGCWNRTNVFKHSSYVDMTTMTDHNMSCVSKTDTHCWRSTINNYSLNMSTQWPKSKTESFPSIRCLRKKESSYILNSHRFWIYCILPFKCM